MCPGVQGRPCVDRPVWEIVPGTKLEGLSKIEEEDVVKEKNFTTLKRVLGWTDRSFFHCLLPEQRETKRPSGHEFEIIVCGLVEM